MCPGILQFPMYTHAMPHYYSFGAIGSLLGHFVHHLIDDRGSSGFVRLLCFLIIVIIEGIYIALSVTPSTLQLNYTQK